MIFNAKNDPSEKKKLLMKIEWKKFIYVTISKF